MRHVGTLIAAIVIAPLAWLLLAFGEDRSTQAFASAQPHAADFARPLEFLVAAGLLLGIIATLRLSPLGAMLTGLAYGLSYGLLLVAPQGVLRLFSHEVSIVGRHVDLAGPIRTGTTLVLGALMLMATLSVGRWRRWPRRADDEPAFAEDRDRPVGLDGLDIDPPVRQREPLRRREPDLVAQHRTTGFESTGFFGSTDPVSTDPVPTDPVPTDPVSAGSAPPRLAPAGAGRPPWPWGSSRPRW